MTRLWRLFSAILIISIALVGCATSKSKEEKAALEARIHNVVILNTQLAAAYLQRGQPEIAMDNISKALTLAPDDPQANNVMALLQWRLKEYDKADEHFKRSLEHDPDNSETRNNYGAFLCEKGEVDASVEQFRLALKDPLYPTPAQANLNAGLCLMKKPAPLDAEVYLRQALRIEPKLPDALFQMARISYDTGRTLSARGFIQRFFEIADDTPQSLLLAVKIEDALGSKDAEASFALRLKGKFPDSPEAKELRRLSLKRK
ncbi:MAG: type IV pilus biogenesis/stability protein PilW [Acidiferrobacterales bacterium]